VMSATISSVVCNLLGSYSYATPFKSLLSHLIISLNMQPMMTKGFERIIWAMWVMLGWICCCGFHQKYRIIALTFEPKILTKANHKTIQKPAQPSHHLLIHPDKDEQRC
jgi:hypothetical protein